MPLRSYVVLLHLLNKHHIKYTGTSLFLEDTRGHLCSAYDSNHCPKALTDFCGATYSNAPSQGVHKSSDFRPYLDWRGVLKAARPGRHF